ncbi:unnamed protein product [Peronospora farinosa]|uniref:Uncharacterized protein n=1 Tax=Peronospora farinosa TaxID=134698 RepID=A0AAV0TMT6_9STRA|nr:unnamed protein product [Peronospora farinosa]
MYEVLATHFKVDDLARILVKGAESDVGEEMNGRARSLLDFQSSNGQIAIFSISRPFPRGSASSRQYRRMV